MVTNEIYDTIIVGGGPAGLTAAIYATRANLKALVLAGYEAGGQLMLTTQVENYPGFPDGVIGPELMALFRQQAERFGATFVDEDAEAVDFSQRPFRVSTDDRSFLANSVILATGASARWLGVPSEQRLRGRGVSTCATCDGAFFNDREVVVVGGGDSAMEEALFLTRFASSVKVIHRRSQLRASKIMQERARKHPKIEFMLNTRVIDYLGEEAVAGVVVEDVVSGERRELSCGGVFVAIGHTPNTAFLGDQVTLDEAGYIRRGDGSATSVDGVFCAGDVHDLRYRKAITAAGAGCQAAIDCARWIEGNLDHTPVELESETVQVDLQQRGENGIPSIVSS